MWAIVWGSSRIIHSIVLIIWKHCIAFSWQLWFPTYLVLQGTLSEVQNSKKDLETKVEALRTVKETAEQPEKVAKERHLKAWEGKSLMWLYCTTYCEYGVLHHSEAFVNSLLFDNVLWSTDRIVVNPKCQKKKNIRIDNIRSFKVYFLNLLYLLFCFRTKSCHSHGERQG